MTLPDPDSESPAVAREALVDLCRSALRAAGASSHVAELLTATALIAEDRGLPGVGISHLLDFLSAMDEGRLNGSAVPELKHASQGIITCDARGGVLHTGFEEAFKALVAAARELGVAVFAQHGAYSGGQLGWFTERLASAGLVALATATSPALLATGPGTGRVFGTNPLAYSIPRRNQHPITVDQASSATAFVSVREAAAQGNTIPEGWALDAEGRPTTDPWAALAGAMLPFGGYKGANIAWLVELLSSMAGGRWSVDAPSFDRGSECPSIGMFVLAVDHRRVGPDFPSRVESHVDRLAGRGVRPPGLEPVPVPPSRLITVRADVLTILRRRAEQVSPQSHSGPSSTEQS